MKPKFENQDTFLSVYFHVVLVLSKVVKLHCTYYLYKAGQVLCQGLLFHGTIRVYCTNSGVHYRIVVADALLIECGCIW